ncbi:MAG TPA: hypothetical protein VIY73_00905 [Polyangiaceae bacterium]
MTQAAGSSCCVCGATDARTLVDVVLRGGTRSTLCGSHAVMHRRSTIQATSELELRRLLRDRRGRRDRREENDELGAALNAAFNGDKRGPERRRA